MKPTAKPGHTPEKSDKDEKNKPHVTPKPGSDEPSHRITPVDPELPAQDTVRDAKDRWDTESPAVKGHPQRSVPEPDSNPEDTENPDEGEDDDLLKKRDETGVA